MDAPENPIDLQKYLTWIEDGKSFSVIRADLEKTGYSTEKIEFLIKEINDQSLSKVLHKSKKSRSLQLILLGSALIILGLAATSVRIAIPNVVVVAPGIIFSGILLIGYALRIQKRQKAFFSKSMRRKFKKGVNP